MPSRSVTYSRSRSLARSLDSLSSRLPCCTRLHRKHFSNCPPSSYPTEQRPPQPRGSALELVLASQWASGSALVSESALASASALASELASESALGLKSCRSELPARLPCLLLRQSVLGLGALSNRCSRATVAKQGCLVRRLRSLQIFHQAHNK